MPDPDTSNPSVALMSLLLSDRELRERFRSNRQALVVELTDDPEAAQFLNSIDASQLDAQAETLISKRQHEVAELLPETWRQLGNEAARLFRTYADKAPWPAGHQRHILDAQSFAEWLSQSQQPVIVSEANRIRFIAANSRLAVHLIRDARTLVGVQVLMRQRNGRIRQTAIGIRWPLWPVTSQTSSVD